MIERQREIKGEVSVERTLYICSQGVSSAQALVKAARGYLRVEFFLYWILDVTFRENERRVRTGHAPRNLQAIRKFALTLLRQDHQYPKRSLHSRRKTADRITDCRESLLGLQALGVNATALQRIKISEHSVNNSVTIVNYCICF